MIDEKKLIEKLKQEILETYHEDCILALERAMEIVKEQPKVGEWIPANQPPTEFNIFGYSDDVLLKVKWENENEDDVFGDEYDSPRMRFAIKKNFNRLYSFRDNKIYSMN